MRFLKQLRFVLLALSILLLPCLTSAYANGPQLSFQSEMGRMAIGSFENPVDVGQINNLRADVINNATARLGDEASSSDSPKANLVLPSGYEGEIVAYGLFVGNDGVPSQYVAIAGNEQSVASAQQRATAWYERESSRIASTDYNARGASWEEIARYGDSNDAYPYGSVQNSYVLHWLSDDNNNDLDWFAIDHTYWMEPGCYVSGWSTDWENEQGWSFHDYSSGGSTDALFSRSPTGTKTPQTVNVSVTGGSGGFSATLYWSFDLSVSMQDQSSGVYEYAKWNLYNINNSQRNGPQGMEPGSVVQVFQPDPGWNIILCELTSEAQFERQWYLTTHNVALTYELDVAY